MEAGDAADHGAPDRQAARERAFRMLAATVTALFLAFASLGAVFVWYDKSADRVSETQDVRDGIDDVLQALTDVESAQRGYVLTGDPALIIRFEAAKSRADLHFTQLVALTAGDPEREARVKELRRLMDVRLRVANQTVMLRTSGDAVAAIRVIRVGEGMRAMDGIRRIVAELDAEEARVEADRAAQVRIVRAIVIFSLVAFAGILAALFIKALRDMNRDREAEARISERLRALVAERTLLVDEVNHRVKNSLQQIASVVRLQARTVHQPETREVLAKTLDRIMAVGRVHEQLYKAGAAVGAFEAGAYARELARDLVASLAREDVELVADVEPIILDLRQATPLAIILNELVTNALKYGCSPDRPCRIRVTLRAVDDGYRLSVADDGDGLPEGFSPQDKKGLGMRAIEALARQLGGRFVVEQPESGAAFAVVFPRS